MTVSNGGSQAEERPDVCLEADRIVDVCQLLGADPVAMLKHVLECSDCRTVFESAVGVRTAFDPDPVRVAALAERVSEEFGIAARTAAAPMGSRRVKPLSGLGRWGLLGANWFAAAMAGFWGVLLVSSGSVGVGAGLAAATLVGALTGCIPLLGLLTHPPATGT